MSDRLLPRLVAVSLAGLAFGGLAAGTLLRLRGIDGSPIESISATGVGALAGFFAGAKFNTEA